MLLINRIIAFCVLGLSASAAAFPVDAIAIMLPVADDRGFIDIRIEGDIHADMPGKDDRGNVVGAESAYNSLRESALMAIGAKGPHTLFAFEWVQGFSIPGNSPKDGLPPETKDRAGSSKIALMSIQAANELARAVALGTKTLGPWVEVLNIERNGSYSASREPMSGVNRYASQFMDIVASAPPDLKHYLVANSSSPVPSPLTMAKAEILASLKNRPTIAQFRNNLEKERLLLQREIDGGNPMRKILMVCANDLAEGRKLFEVVVSAAKEYGWVKNEKDPFSNLLPVGNFKTKVEEPEEAIQNIVTVLLLMGKNLRAASVEAAFVLMVAEQMRPGSPVRTVHAIMGRGHMINVEKMVREKLGIAPYFSARRLDDVVRNASKTLLTIKPIGLDEFAAFYAMPRPIVVSASSTASCSSSSPPSSSSASCSSSSSPSSSSPSCSSSAAVTPFSATREVDCAHCGNIGDFKTCSQCHGVSYCGKVCQRADWPTHKATCKATTDKKE